MAGHSGMAAAGSFNSKHKLGWLKWLLGCSFLLLCPADAAPGSTTWQLKTHL